MLEAFGGKVLHAIRGLFASHRSALLNLAHGHFAGGMKTLSISSEVAQGASRSR